MKKITTLIIAAAASTLSACSGFLDIEPQGKMTQDVFFSEEEGAQEGINAIYAQLRQWNIIGYAWFAAMELPSDNSDTGSELSDGSVPRLNTVDFFNYDASESDIAGWWTGNYNAIATCNVALDNLDVLSDETVRTRSIAQARFFRGFFYFNLVRAFGGVPLVTKVQNPDEYDQPRATADEVYAQIIDDLTYAADNLPTRSEWGTDQLGRVTKGTAEGLLAKVYLFRGDYANCKKYTSLVISGGQYKLYPDYRDLFSPDQYYCDEIMLADQYLWTADRDVASEYVKWQGVRGAGMGWGYLVPSESLDKAYEAGDPRRTATIFYKGESVEGKGV
ncbi:MAG: RagB/SusD family nutrient uptake outer membrane protein, partial [Mediterranea sp.]|nr:RagB/SusD family nutrient uptake outer membrane protein [Mediterranea sp.]